MRDKRHIIHTVVKGKIHKRDVFTSTRAQARAARQSEAGDGEGGGGEGGAILDT